MYAIIETGGKQFRVQEGDTIDVELLGTDQPAIVFDQVLFLHDGKMPQVGIPHVPKAAVHAELLGEIKGPKVIAYKFIPCKNSRRKKGHRQRYSRIKITKIVGSHGT
jgi:large subunit ribosomal protein L21